MKTAYLSDGIRGFEIARNQMRAQEGTLAEDVDYDIASMVLGLSETATTRKESELATCLRTLADYIEAHPGQADAQQEELKDKLFSYFFGNGPIDYGSVPARLAELYVLIATGNSSKGAPSFANLATTPPEQLFGTYVVTEYVRYRGGLTREDWAKAQVGTKIVLSRETFRLRDSVTCGPKYATRYFEDLPEGEVPSGERRLLTKFHGFGAGRDGVTVLDVYVSSADNGLVHTFEVIDDDTLWDTYDGWLFQLCREGRESRVASLKERSPGGDSR